MKVPENIYEQLRRDEGVRDDLYMDPEGWLTLGVGHRLRSRPLSDRAIQQILEDDVEATRQDLVAAHPWAQRLSPCRFEVLLNMAFNLGVNGLGGFKKMLVAVQNERWDDAAQEIMQSEYAKQVGDRAKRLAKQMAEDRRV